ncbi:MAG: histidine phosphatase family protein [Acholeplasmataceae bacterium]
MKTHFIFIRHGEPRYDETQNIWQKSVGYNFGKLTENGEDQALEVAKNPLLKDADIIVSSPYTRALQTAAIISRITGIKLVIENDLHEWNPDTNFIFDFEDNLPFEEYLKNKGIHQLDDKYRWEAYKDIKKRVELSLLRYKNYKKVIVVSHGIVMSTVTRFDDVIEYCGIREVDI